MKIQQVRPWGGKSGRDLRAGLLLLWVCVQVGCQPNLSGTWALELAAWAPDGAPPQVGYRGAFLLDHGSLGWEGQGLVQLGAPCPLTFDVTGTLTAEDVYLFSFGFLPFDCEGEPVLTGADTYAPLALGLTLSEGRGEGISQGVKTLTTSQAEPWQLFADSEEGVPPYLATLAAERLER